MGKEKIAALIGHSGFVGSTLLRQTDFDALYRSTTISEVVGRAFDLVVCAAAPAQKWIANKNPQADRETVAQLMAHLETLTCKRFVLVSTVDVFERPDGVDEDTPIDRRGLQPYGLHRHELEDFVRARFPHSLIVRLPGLVGPYLRKNVIFDFLNDNNLHTIDSRHIFQFYPMVNLWADIQTALDADLKLVHLTAEPVSVAYVARHGFNRPFTQVLDGRPMRYDMRTRHAALFGGAGGYQYSQRESIMAIRAYAQSEHRKVADAA